MQSIATNQRAFEPRHLLPKDLAGSLRRLDDGEIDTLLAAATAEAERRGGLPEPQPRAAAKLAGTGQPLNKLPAG